MATRGSATLFVPGRPKRKSWFRGFRIRSPNPDGLTLTIFTFEGEDLTDEQRQFLEENREQIQQTIAKRFKEAGVKDMYFVNASEWMRARGIQYLKGLSSSARECHSDESILVCAFPIGKDSERHRGPSSAYSSPTIERFECQPNTARSRSTSSV